MYSVLIVDDEFQTRSGLRDLVDWQSLGLRIAGDAEDGEDALPLLIQKRPDILLTDVRMNRMDGIELARKAREIMPDVAIIFLSGYAESEYLRSAIRLEAVDYLYKPVRMAELKALLAKVVLDLREKHSRRAQLEKNRLLLEKSKPLLIERFLRSWFSGLMEDPAAVRERLEMLELPFNESGVTGAAFQPEWSAFPSVGQAESYQIALEKAIRARIGDALTCADGTGVLALIPDDGGRLIAAPTEALRSVEAAMRADTDIPLLIGVSAYHADWTETPEAMREAQEAVSCCATPRTAPISFYAEGENALHSVPEQPEAYMMSCYLLTGDFASLWKILEDSLAPIAPDASGSRQARKLLMIFALQAEYILEKQGVRGLEALDFCRKMAENLPVSSGRRVLHDSLRDACERVRTQREKEYSAAVAQALRLIHDNYAGHIGLDDIARAVHYSPAHLSTMFRRETGMTIGDALLREKLSAAMLMLRTTSKSISGVARETGYEDVQYFSRVFKRFTLMTPLEYRRKALA